MSEKKLRVSYLAERPNTIVLVATMIFMVSVAAYPAINGIPVSQFIQDNAALMFFGVVVLLVPLFIGATRATLVSDLMDQELLPQLKLFFEDFTNYETQPLKMTIARLYIAKADHRSSSMKNLALGVGFSVVSLTLVIQLAVASNAPAVLQLSSEDFLLKHIAPKTGAIIFVQLIATFFFRLYSKNIQSLAIVSDTMTMIEMKIAALQISDHHRDELRKWLVEFSIESALLAHRKEPPRWNIPSKAIENLKVTLGK